MKNQFKRKIYAFLSSEKYALFFSATYASIIGTLFYPGLLYSDSVARWNTAILLANNGIDALASVSDHHPIFPIFIMSFFYKITGEIGLFSLIQVFIFSLSLFFIVRHYSPSLAGNVFASLTLMLPVNQVYSIFVSYDSLFSVFMGLLILAFLSKSKAKVLLIPLLLAALVGTRLNSIVIVPVVVTFAFFRQFGLTLSQRCVTGLLCVLSVSFTLTLPAVLGMSKGNSWLIGTAWEYANLATKTHDKRDVSFLKSFGTSPEDIIGGVCYHGIWCGKEREAFIDRVPNERGTELLRQYALVAKDHPAIFFDEKLKYIKSLMGVGYKLQNAEIGRWRESSWRDAMKSLHFETSEKKEKLIDLYFRFSDSEGRFLFRPWLIFFILAISAFALQRHEKKTVLMTLIPIVYYMSFFISSQNHEFRYFYPVVFILMAYLSALSAMYGNQLYSKLRNSSLFCESRMDTLKKCTQH